MDCYEYGIFTHTMKSSKTALITGITGQDGAYLAELLLEKGYHVHGIKRRSSLFNTERIDHLYQDLHEQKIRFKLHYGDLTDSTNLIRIIQEVQPDEIYNLAAQSHVKVSFETPEYTANADALGTLRILEAIRILGLEKKTRFYQASTSELYGLVQEVPQKESTPFYPRSPYASQNQRIGGVERLLHDDQHIVGHRRQGDEQGDHSDEQAGGKADREQVERGGRARQHPHDEVEAQQQEADRQRQQLWSWDIKVILLNLLPSAHNLALTDRSLKEYLGILFYNLRGWK